MTLLVAIEGADGAGKATAAKNVCAALITRRLAAKVVSFPRYQETVAGATLGDYLSGRLPVPLNPKAAAVLYGLDRFESLGFVREAIASHDVIIFDRYIASNMVYQASKAHCDEAAELMGWIYRLETETFEAPSPDLSIYLDTPLDAARRLIQFKGKRSYTDRQFDENEADVELQRAVRHHYSNLASTGLAGPWRVVRTTVADKLRPPREIALEIVNYVLTMREKEDRRETEQVIASGI